MEIWIFKPSKNWHYCGGAIVVVASSFEEASKMAAASDNKIYRKEEEVPDSVDYSCWVLVCTLPTAETEVPRVVLEDYNWA